MSGRSVIEAIRPVLAFIMVLWLIEVLNLLLNYRLNIWFGLEPRRLTGLIGVPAMPLLHGGIGHLAANTLPLGILGVVGLIVAKRRFWEATVAIVLLSGLAVWLLARDGIVVGASGLIFGWFGFLVAFGLLEQSLRAIAGSVLVIAIYGGMIWGILPQDDARISWEAHFLGAAAGAAVAWYLAGRRTRADL